MEERGKSVSPKGQNGLWGLERAKAGFFFDFFPQGCVEGVFGEKMTAQPFS